MLGEVHHLAHLAHRAHPGVFHVDGRAVVFHLEVAQALLDGEHRLGGLHLGLHEVHPLLHGRFEVQLLERGVGVRFNGNEKTNVEEYCVSEGWVRLAVGKTLDRKGKQLTIKYSGKVEPYFQDSPKETGA